MAAWKDCTGCANIMEIKEELAAHTEQLKLLTEVRDDVKLLLSFKFLLVGGASTIGLISGLASAWFFS